MAKDKAPEAAPEVTLADALALMQEMRAKMDAMEKDHARVVKLLAKQEGEETPELKAHKAWAELPAQAKTQLVIDREPMYGPGPGKKQFFVSMKDHKGKPEFFGVKLHAHSEIEACGLYRQVMGINETKGTITAVAA